MGWFIPFIIAIFRIAVSLSPTIARGVTIAAKISPTIAKTSAVIGGSTKLVAASAMTSKLVAASAMTTKVAAAAVPVAKTVVVGAAVSAAVGAAVLGTALIADSQARGVSNAAVDSTVVGDADNSKPPAIECNPSCRREETELVNDPDSTSVSDTGSEGSDNRIRGNINQNNNDKSNDNNNNNQDNYGSDEDDGNDNTKENNNNKDEFRYRIRSVTYHILARFERYIRFGGAIQRISEATGIPRNEVVVGGASQFQDQSSNRGRSIHAAHVVRAGAINDLLRSYPPYVRYYMELRNFLGHTQSVPRFANDWGGLGGNIDRLQSGTLETLARIDFSGSFTTEVASILRDIRNEFTNLLINEATEDGLRIEYEEALRILGNIDLLRLFEDEGKGGYLGWKMKRYQPKK